MMPTGLFSQIALIILSVGIVFTYITPKLDEVEKAQDTIEIYKTQYSKVSEVNMKLDQVATKLNSINSDDQRKLLTYMPDSVDTVAVPRDIKAIADGAGLLLGQVEYVGPKVNPANSGFIDPSMLDALAQNSDDPEAHVFAVDFESSYEQIKKFIGDLEKNAYPLEVHDLVIKKSEGGFLSVQMKIVTYDRLQPAAPIDPNLIVPSQVAS